MAFVNELNQEEKVIRPEKVDEIKTEPKPEEKLATAAVPPVEAPKAAPVPGEEPKAVEGEPSELDKLLAPDEKKEGEPKEGETETLDAYIEAKGGKEFVDQATDFFGALLSKDFKEDDFVEEMETVLPDRLNGICRAIVKRYPDWIAQKVLGVSIKEVNELRQVKQDYLSRRNTDEDSLIKEYEESGDEDKVEKAKLMRENKLYREQQRKDKARDDKDQADRDDYAINQEKQKLAHTTYNGPIELFKKANYQPVTEIKPGQALTRQQVYAAMVHGAFVHLFDADQMAGGKYSDALANIDAKQFSAANPLKPLLQDKANKYGKIVLECMNELIGKARKYDEQQQKPAIERREPPVVGAQAPGVPAGNQVPEKAFKIGSKDEDAWISAKVKELQSTGKISTPNGR